MNHFPQTRLLPHPFYDGTTVPRHINPTLRFGPVSYHYVPIQHATPLYAAVSGALVGVAIAGPMGALVGTVVGSVLGYLIVRVLDRIPNPWLRR